MNATDDDHSPLPTTEDERIMWLAKYTGINKELIMLAKGDPRAPDEGALHARYERLLEQEREACRELCRLGPPLTPRGAKLAAKIALKESPHRLQDGTLECNTFRDWLDLMAVVAAAGSREQIRPSPFLLKWLGDEGPAELEEAAAEAAPTETAEVLA